MNQQNVFNFGDERVVGAMLKTSLSLNKTTQKFKSILKAIILSNPAHSLIKMMMDTVYA